MVTERTRVGIAFGGKLRQPRACSAGPSHAMAAPRMLARAAMRRESRRAARCAAGSRAPLFSAAWLRHVVLAARGSTLQKADVVQPDVVRRVFGANQECQAV
jgi:hypothetical protein